MNQLQKALLTNAIFSGTSGILLIVLGNQVANLFKTSNTVIFWIIGTVLLFFSASIVYQIKRQHYLGTLIIIIQDFLWVLASIILLILRPFKIAIIGYVLIAVVALIVLLLAVKQVKALAQTHECQQKNNKSSMGESSKSRRRIFGK